MPVARERDDRAPAIGLDIAAQRRDFDGMATARDRDRAVLDAGWIDGEPGFRDGLDHGFRQQVGRNIDIGDR